jgi:hypothetical protein
MDATSEDVMRAILQEMEELRLPAKPEVSFKHEEWIILTDATESEFALAARMWLANPVAFYIPRFATAETGLLYAPGFFTTQVRATLCANPEHVGDRFNRTFITHNVDDAFASMGQIVLPSLMQDLRRMSDANRKLS